MTRTSHDFTNDGQNRADDLLGLKLALLDGVEPLALALLGEPVSRRDTPWRWSGMGGFTLYVTGAKRGLWGCYADGRGNRSLLDLIIDRRGGSFAEAVRWARDWTGHTGKAEPVRDAAADARRARAEARKAARDVADSRARARGLWAHARPLGGTLAERYLTETRGLPLPPGGWPDALRWHGRPQSLIVARTEADGTVQAVQRTFLDAEARKREPNPRRSCGQETGHLPVRLPGDPAGWLALAEGVENALSVWGSVGVETWAALGSVANLLPPPPDRRLLVVADDDLPGSPADAGRCRHVEALRSAGHTVVVVTPWDRPPGDLSPKRDMNDVLRSGGAEAVRQRVDMARLAAASVPRRLPKAEARQLLDEVTSVFYRAAPSWHRPAKGEEGELARVQGIRADVGLGKSTSGRTHMIAMLTGMRQRLDMRSAAVSVPTHDLGDEAAMAFADEAAADLARTPEWQASDLTVRVWRGRTAADPDAPAGQAMCRDLDRVAVARAAKQTVQTTCCKSATPGGPVVTCPFYETCGYQRQARATADVWYFAHELLPLPRPANFGELVTLTVDEPAWTKFLRGTKDPIVLPLAELEADCAILNDKAATERLRTLRDRALEALAGEPAGAVRRSALVSGFTEADGHEARKLEDRRFVDARMRPDMASSDRKRAAEGAAGNGMVRLLGMFWRSVAALVADDGPQASGWLALDGDKLRLKGRASLGKGWDVSTLLTEATFNADLVRPIWPSVEVVADIRAQTPHQHVWQVVDFAYAASQYDLGEKRTETERKNNRRHLRELVATLATAARRYATGRVLVIVQKAVRKEIESGEFGTLPDNVVMAHHNAVAGMDCFKDVVLTVVVGRTAPAPATVEMMAEALSGCAVAPLLNNKGRRAQWYPQAMTRRQVAGAWVDAEADFHPDPLCEAIRHHQHEGGLDQCIGRPRGVNREAHEPSHVLVMTCAPLAIDLAGVLLARDLKPTPHELTLATCRVAFVGNAADVADACPVLWEKADSAKRAVARSRPARCGTKWGKERELPPRDCPAPPGVDPAGLRRVNYQRTGAGNEATWALCDASVADPAALLAELLGEPLAWCEAAALPVVEADPRLETRAKPPQQSDQVRLPAAHSIAMVNPSAPVWRAMDLAPERQTWPPHDGSRRTKNDAICVGLSECSGGGMAG